MGIQNINRTLIFGMKALGSENVIRPYSNTQVRKIDVDLNEKSTKLERMTPEEAGISSDRIRHFLRSLKNDNSIDMHNVLIVKDGKVITEACFGGYDLNCPRYSFSACKSVTSMAIGLLYDEGKLKLSDKIVDILNEEIPAISKIFSQKITVEDVLTMRSAITFNEATTAVSKDWLTDCFTTPLIGNIGESFNYNSINTYILSRIVCKLSGKSMSEYLDEKIFTHLGIKEYYWEKCPKGYEIGGWGLYIKHEDFAKLGLLVLNKGRYDGKQLISEEYINMATTSQVETPKDYGDFNYGYQIWVNRHHKIYLFNGMFGQNVCIMPDNNMVIVSGAGIDEMFQQSSYYTHLSKYFYNKIRPEQGNYDKLIDYLSYLKDNCYDERQFMYSNISKKETKTFLDYLDKKTFRVEKHNSVGVMPFTTSLVCNKYASGIQEISFNQRIMIILNILCSF